MRHFGTNTTGTVFYHRPPQVAPTDILDPATALRCSNGTTALAAGDAASGF